MLHLLVMEIPIHLRRISADVRKDHMEFPWNVIIIIATTITITTSTIIIITMIITIIVTIIITIILIIIIINIIIIIIVIILAPSIFTLVKLLFAASVDHFRCEKY